MSGRVRRRPVEAGENAGERSGEIRHAVGDDRQADDAKRAGSPLALSTMPRALRRQPRQHALEDRSRRRCGSAPCRRRPCGAPARPRGRGRGWADLSRHAPPPCAGAWRFPPRRRRGPGRTRCGSSPASATKRLPRARPISVRLALRASSTPQAVKPEREIRIGMPMRTRLDHHLGGEPAGGVENLVVAARTRFLNIQPAILSTALWRPTSSM